MPNLTLLAANDTTYTVNTDEPLNAGQLLIFWPSQTIGSVGSRVELTTNYIVNVATADLADTSVDLYRWWQLKEPSSAVRTVGRNFFAPPNLSEDGVELDATLLATATSLPKDHTAGSLGWDLWYRPDSKHPWLHILKGNDRYAPGVCAFTQLGASWPAGLWLFKAAAFYTTNLVPLATTEVAFNYPLLTSSFKFNFTFNHNYDLF